MRRREMAGCGHPLPFAAAAGLALGLALFAHQLLLTLAAVVIGPLPAVQTALYLSRKDLSENAAQAVSEPAQETQAEPAQEAPALPAGDIEAYLVPLEGDEARPEGAGAILEKNYPQGSGEKYIPCGSGSIKNNTSVSSADIAAEITNPLPFAVEWNSPDPQILIMHTHATEDYRLSAGLWYRPGDGSRTTDRDLNMCAVGRVMADTLNAAGLNTLHDETLNDYPSYTGSYANSRAVVQQYLSQYPSIKIVLDVHRDAAAVVGDGDGVAVVDGHVDLGTVTGQRLVNGVVHDLVHQMMQTALTGGADIHTRALAHRLQTLQHLDLAGVILVVGRGIGICTGNDFFCHILSPFT